MPPCVYFIQAGHRGPIKIGITIDIDVRLSALRGAHTQLVLNRYLSDIFGVETGDDDHADWVRWAWHASDQSWRAKLLDLTLTNTVSGAYQTLEAAIHAAFTEDRLTHQEANALGLPQFTEWFQATPQIAHLAETLPRNPWLSLRGRS